MGFDDPGEDRPCCGACGHAAEVAKRGGPAPSREPHLAFTLTDGTPRGLVLMIQRAPDEAPELRPIDRPRIVVGRKPPSDVVIPEPVVSRQQCVLDFSTGEAVVSDLGTGCGTFVNGVRIARPTALRAGDVLHVGNATLAVKRR